MNKQNNLGIVLTVVAILAGVGLGYVYLKPYFKAPPGIQKENAAATLDSTGLTDDEKKVYAIINDPNGKLDFALVEETAERAKTLTVGGNCAVSPLVLETTHGSMLKVTNADPENDHTLYFGANATTYVVPASSTKEIKLDFKDGPGVYQFICDAAVAGARSEKGVIWTR